MYKLGALSSYMLSLSSSLLLAVIFFTKTAAAIGPFDPECRTLKNLSQSAELMHRDKDAWLALMHNCLSSPDSGPGATPRFSAPQRLIIPAQPAQQLMPDTAAQATRHAFSESEFQQAENQQALEVCIKHGFVPGSPSYAACFSGQGGKQANEPTNSAGLAGNQRQRQGRTSPNNQGGSVIDVQNQPTGEMLSACLVVNNGSNDGESDRHWITISNVCKTPLSVTIKRKSVYQTMSAVERISTTIIYNSTNEYCDGRSLGCEVNVVRYNFAR